jgi:hypothetical protein
MRPPLRAFERDALKVMKVLTALAGVFFLVVPAFAQISSGPRQTGEEVLRELLMGPNKFIVSVASNGCTDKGSFKVDVKKEAGLTSSAPHYVLTLKRVEPDECKALVPEGTLVLFDLAEDLGIRGNFTYSLTNRVLALSKAAPSDESMMSIIERYLTPAGSEKIKK